MRESFYLPEIAEGVKGIRRNGVVTSSGSSGTRLMKIAIQTFYFRW
jgi:hypothetical protein